jgi:hypothetical protein
MEEENNSQKIDNNNSIDEDKELGKKMIRTQNGIYSIDKWKSNNFIYFF